MLSLLFQLAVSVPQPVYHGRAGQTSVDIPRLSETIVVDALLNEPAWQRAALLTGFSVYAPVDNQPAPDSTEVLVWYSRDAIHFGIRAFEPHGAVNSSLADRDRIGSDDNVEIHLDTFGERNRALVFIVNPLGVQADGTKSEGGGFIPGSNVMPGQNDLSADFQWESKGRLTDFGYEVEIRIPFRSIRYATADTQDWGLQIDRRVQHSGYEETWTPAVRANASFITQGGWLRGLSDMRHGQVIELTPELTNTKAGAPDAVAPGDWTYRSTQRIGGNVRWTLGSNFVLNGTVRPDFSQVESDATQIATDPRFSLFYPEKRPFFVEGSDQFNVPNSLVYTRRIVSPDAAMKLTGKLGRTDIAVLSAQDIGAFGTPDDKPIVTIARLRRAIGGQSNVGLLFSDRTADGRANHLGGADARILFKRLYYFQAQAAVSKTTGDAYTGSTNPAGMWDLVVDRTGRSFGFHYSILGIDSAFRTDNGFVSRTGYVSPSIRNRYTYYGKKGALIERYNMFGGGVGFARYHRVGDGFFEHQLSIQNSVTLRGGWGLSLTPTRTRVTLDTAAYSRLYVVSSTPGSYVRLVVPGNPTALVASIGVTTPQFRKYDASLTLSGGTDVDFAEAAEVDRMTVTGAVNLRPTDRLRVNTTYTSTSYRRKVTGQQTAASRIPRLKVEYQVSRPVFVRIVSQYQSTRRASGFDVETGSPIYVQTTPGNFAVGLPAAFNTWRTDFLFSYRPIPGTVFFAGYGSTYQQAEVSTTITERHRSDDAFFLKFSYLIRATR